MSVTRRLFLSVIGLAIMSFSHKIVKNSKGEFFYLSFKNNPHSRRQIPDITSVKALGFEERQVVHVDDNYLRSFKLLTMSGSLETAAPSPDEMMRVKITKILIIADPVYIKDLIHFPNKLNPSIEFVHDAVLMTYRDQMYDSPIKMLWLTKKDFKELPDNYMNFGLSNNLIPDITTFDFNHLQEDPRLLYRSAQNEIFVEYTSKSELMSEPRMAYTRTQLRQNKVNGKQTTHFTDSVCLDTYKHTRHRNPKNWVMFDYQNKIYFIQNINPMHIVENTHLDTAAHNGTVTTIQSDLKPVALPWSNEYGELIRGGTPAIPLPVTNNNRTLYISFFHTVSWFQQPYQLRTYFMGAITFCGSLPMKIHSMSAHPIVPNSGFYDGQWVQEPVLDYVVFPTGIVLEDESTLLVSFGWQDKDGYIMRMDLQGLLQSMTVVDECR